MPLAGIAQAPQVEWVKKLLDGGYFVVQINPERIALYRVWGSIPRAGYADNSAIKLTILRQYANVTNCN